MANVPNGPVGGVVWLFGCLGCAGTTCSLTCSGLVFFFGEWSFLVRCIGGFFGRGGFWMQWFKLVVAYASAAFLYRWWMDVVKTMGGFTG